MKFYLSYIRERWRGIAAAGIFCFIFVAAFALYHLPVEAVAYPAGLCTLLGGILTLSGLRRARHRHQTLDSIRSLEAAAAGVLPRPVCMEEEDYQRIIGLICEEHNRYLTEAGRRYSDMMDYYTVWVHQIKTPIASMRLHLQNEDSALSHKLSADLFRVEQYVEMVLAFLRLDAEGTDYVIKEYDLDGIVKQAVRKFAGEFIVRRLRLEYEPLHTEVITDEKWLSFVVEQVLSNALKYTPSGRITITLEPEKKLCIRDTGIGIAPEDIPRIFENGFTGYNGRSDKKSSGIGLYLCRRICTNLGHRITAESTVGEGTAITIDLKRADLSVE
ncbi:MAG: sensor histidine kinase [Kineothrix sp.]